MVYSSSRLSLWGNIYLVHTPVVYIINIFKFHLHITTLGALTNDWRLVLTQWRL